MFIDSEVKITVDQETSTKDLLQVYDISMNTDEIEFTLKEEQKERPIIPSEIGLLDEEMIDDPLEVYKVEKEEKEEKAKPTSEVNYFTDLVE